MANPAQATPNQNQGTPQLKAKSQKMLAKTIARYGRVDLLMIDLCRDRDYAEAGAGRPSPA